MIIRTCYTPNGLYAITITFPWFKKEYSPIYDKEIYKPYVRAWVFKGREKVGYYKMFSRNPFGGLIMFEGEGRDQLEKFISEKRLEESGIKKRDE